MPQYIEVNLTQEIMTQKFLMELNLKIPTMCPVQSTVYHFNNRDASQIDYFLSKVWEWWKNT